MSSKTEDFPTPVSPTSRMVYGLFALFLDILMIPFLRDSTSLENTVISDASEISLWTYLIIWMSSSSELATSSSSARISLPGLAILSGEWVESPQELSEWWVINIGDSKSQKTYDLRD